MISAFSICVRVAISLPQDLCQTDKKFKINKINMLWVLSGLFKLHQKRKFLFGRNFLEQVESAQISWFSE